MVIFEINTILITCAIYAFVFRTGCCYQQSFNSNASNVVDILADVGENLELDCDIDGVHVEEFEWFRKKEDWFSETSIMEKIGSRDQKIMIAENEVSTVLYKCVARQGTVFKNKLFRLYVDRIPRKKRGKPVKI